MIKIVIAAVTAGSVLVFGAACGQTPGRTAPEPKDSKKFHVTKTTPKKWRDGTHEVGVNIMPGKYETYTSSEAGCLWERLRGISGEPKDIIANSYNKGMMRMEVKKTDKYINFSGGCVWVQDK